MFDTPDLAPLCIAPFIALFVAVLLSGVSALITFVVRKNAGKMPNWWDKRLPFIIIVLSIAACFASVALGIGSFNEPAPWFAPRPSNFVGTWKMTLDDVEYLKERNITVEPHELVFNSDGTFHVTNIPAFWGIHDSLTKKWIAKYMSGSGTWRLSKVDRQDGMEWIIFAQFQEIDGSQVDQSKEDNLVRFYFIGHLPPYTLASIDGDVGFRFERK